MHLQESVERISSYSKAQIFFLIFTLSFFVRILLSVIYALRFGRHAVPYAETYYYYGVLKGTYVLSCRDPTQWLFSGTKLLVPSEYLYSCIILLGIFFMSLSASLVFLLASELYGKKAGLASGLLYSFLAEPLTMGILLFTHDLVQLPLLLLSFLFALLLLREKRLYLKMLYLVILLACFYTGWAINAVIFIAFEVIALYCAFLLTDRLAFRAGIVHDIKPYMLGGIVLISIFLKLAGILTIPAIIRLISTLFPVYSYESLLTIFKSGSPDFVPVTLDAIWTRYNVFLLIFPFSIYIVFKKKIYFPLILLFVASLNASFFDRGTRILDMAFALIAFQAFFEWNSLWNRAAYLILFSGFLVAIVYILGMPFYITIFMAFFLPLLLFLGFVYYAGILGAKGAGCLLFSLILLVNIPFTYAVVTFHPPQVTETEWRAAQSLPEDKGTVLVSWAQGFFMQAVSGHPSQSHPASIDYLYYEVLMMGEEEAYAVLKKENISYLLVNDREFKFYIDPETNKLTKIIHPYFSAFLPPDAGADYVKKTLAYRLLYESYSIKRFRVIYEGKDEATGMMVKIFVVQP